MGKGMNGPVCPADQAWPYDGKPFEVREELTLLCRRHYVTKRAGQLLDADNIAGGGRGATRC